MEDTYTVKETHELLEKLSEKFTTEVEKLRKEMHTANIRLESKMDVVVKDVVELKKWRSEVEGKVDGISFSGHIVYIILIIIMGLVTIFISLNHKENEGYNKENTELFDFQKGGWSKEKRSVY